jgi:hypothetical protein
VVPYSRQIVLLAAAVFRAAARPDAGADMLDLLVAWLWLTTYSELFAGISGGRFKRVHEQLQATMETGRLAWPGWRPFSRRPLPARYDFRSARGKALALRLVEQKPKLPDGSEIQLQCTSGADHLRNSVVQIVPRTRISAASFASAGNRFLVPPEYAAAFRSELISIHVDPTAEQVEQRRAWLASHVVSEKALRLLDTGSLEAFVRQREADLNALEQAFVERHLAILDEGTPDISVD